MFLIISFFSSEFKSFICLHLFFCLTAASSSTAQNSLDSDEEEEDDEQTDDKKYNLEHDDSGEEDATVDFDGDIKITPFNMKEELEEGKFDADGTYHVNKEAEIRDSWLENIDWTRVKPKEKPPSDDEEELPEKFDEVTFYKQMAALMQPGESVSRALKRLGNKAGQKKPLSSMERLRRKKLGLPLDDADPDGAKKEAMIKLTGFADAVLTNLGHMDVYDETYESLNLKIAKASKPAAVDDLDMFSDAPVASSSSGAKKVSFDEADNVEKKVDESSDPVSSEDRVMWVYKLEANPDEEKGPLSSEAMSDMLASTGLDAATVSVRRTDKADGPWYKANRVDFDLYD